MIVTGFNNFADTNPIYITIDNALNRIRDGASKPLIDKIRISNNPELKKKLPCILFSGKFSERKITGLQEYSRIICLDFDKVDSSWKNFLKKYDFIYSAWVSPSGNGVKALVKVSTDDHSAHFLALQNDFHNLDKSGKDVCRICFESYDPDIWVNENCIPYDKVITGEQKFISVTTPETNEEVIFSNIKRWAEKKGEYFVQGNRNNFILRMAAFCNRTGISEGSCKYFLAYEYGSQSDFSREEMNRTITGVYARYAKDFGIACFNKKEEVVDYKTGEILKHSDLLDAEIEVQDVIYFSDVIENLRDLRNKGQMKGETTFFPQMDNHYRYCKTEVTVIHGYGNTGKSTYISYMDLIQAKMTGKKFAVFSPENYPTEHYYKDLVQMYVGKAVDKNHKNPMSDIELEEAYDFVNEHFFYIYPKNETPTPAYILKRFAEMKIKHNIDGVLIDPFNQLDNDWGGRDDRYLESVLTSFKRFAQNADIYFRICAHPSKPSKNKEGGYDCPTYYDLSGGAMWANKCDNILAYHRPEFFRDKMNPACEIHSQKIKKQQMNGALGTTEWAYDYKTFRFRERGFTPLENNTPIYIQEEDVCPF